MTKFKLLFEIFKNCLFECSVGYLDSVRKFAQDKQRLSQDGHKVGEVFLRVAVQIFLHFKVSFVHRGGVATFKLCHIREKLVVNQGVDTQGW